MKIAYLGPDGSFTSLATKEIFPNECLLPCRTISECFTAVSEAKAEKAVIPLENSIEGTVTMTLDELYNHEDLFIKCELVMPIAHHLMVHPQHDTFEKIYSHPQALAQTFRFREKHYPLVPTQEFSSTSASAQRVAQHPDEPWAAIANAHAAKLYGLKILHENIQDMEQNHTKFIVIGKKKNRLTLPLKNTGEKTSLLVTLPDDRSGGLHQVLSVFAWRKMNLSKIESRTLKTGLGNYFFFINVATPWHPVLSENALQELRALGASVKFLGHYDEYLITSPL
ncbi:prephenate dehydratase [Bergeyella sp. RCAD1439]|uniref:prephenate dehydratase n=1 Tax=Bergeyella anatis TaxID=3113737 RepID=UPI002E181AEB|nr:prephenate dehydratase [Bergeyella sp. RCAD1439]